MSREFTLTQNRLEQLLLEMIHDRLAQSAPPNPKDAGDEASEHYKGYYLGYWDAIEAHSQIIDTHNEGNDHRV
jgi:hypothetical protein